MKIYKENNVVDEALERIRFIFDEFPNVVASVSGGKDSTVIFDLTLRVARERGRLPLKVMFIDQEAEYQATINHMRNIMNNPDVQPYWFQMPIKIFNATSMTEHWLQCWKEGDEWIREKEPNSIKVNSYGTDRFHDLFPAIFLKEFSDTPSAGTAGVRAEESPTRYTTLISTAKYKWVTYCKGLNRKKNHFTFYPIYDWSYTDIWKYIFENKLDYNRIYLKFYQYGIPFTKMRVSNLHHETSVHSLFNLQEVEPETYEKLNVRLKGIDMAGKFGKDDFFVHDVPFMFKDKKEYRDFLLEKLTDKKWKESFRDKFKKLDERYAEVNDIDKIYDAEINSILTNDWEFIKLHNMERRPEFHNYRIFKRTGKSDPNNRGLM